MTLTPEDVRNKQFSTVRLREGYEMDEVDAFLDEVEGELTRLGRENDDLRTRLTVTSREPAAPAAAAPAQPPSAPPPPVPAPVPVPPPTPAPAPAPSVPDNAVRMLELAQRTADEHVAQAKGEAERILAEARVGAAKLTGDAQREHVIIQARVEELKAFEREYRTRLRTYLEGQLHDLDQIAGGPPGPPAPNNSAPSGGLAQPAQPAQPSGSQPPPAPPAPPAPPTPPQSQPAPVGAPNSQPTGPARPTNPFGPPPMSPSAPGQPPSAPPASH